MIKDTDVFKIGKLVKPHGVKGEIAFSFDNDVFDKVDCPYLILLIDDIFVPFFIEEYRFKGQDVALVKFEDIDSDIKVKELAGLEVFFPRKYFEEKTEDVDYSWTYFLGFEIVDKVQGRVGEVTAIDESTINTLFLLKDGNKEIIVPASEDFIEKIDDKKKIIYTILPEGLLN